MKKINNIFRSGSGKRPAPRQRSGLRPRPRPEPRQEHPILDNDLKDIKIVNLSAKTLNESEISLLNKGLKFTPTPTVGNKEKSFRRLKRI